MDNLIICDFVRSERDKRTKILRDERKQNLYYGLCFAYGSELCATLSSDKNHRFKHSLCRVVWDWASASVLRGVCGI